MSNNDSRATKLSEELNRRYNDPTYSPERAAYAREEVINAMMGDAELKFNILSDKSLKPALIQDLQKGLNESYKAIYSNPDYPGEVVKLLKEHHNAIKQMKSGEKLDQAKIEQYNQYQELIKEVAKRINHAKELGIKSLKSAVLSNSNLNAEIAKDLYKELGSRDYSVKKLMHKGKRVVSRLGDEIGTYKAPMAATISTSKIKSLFSGKVR